MKDFALFVGRVVAGLLVAGHGAQKLLGWFEGPGLKNWTTATEHHLGMTPAKFWAPVGASAEFVGGILTALGFLNPLGPLAMGSMMIAAWNKGHRGKPIWASKGGAELALSFLGSAIVAGLVGPGRFSLDRLFRVRLPGWVTALALLGSAGMLAEAMRPTFLPKVFGSGPTPANEQQEGN